MADQAVGEGERMFGQHFNHIQMAFLRLIGKPGTPHVLARRVRKERSVLQKMADSSRSFLK